MAGFFQKTDDPLRRNRRLVDLDTERRQSIIDRAYYRSGASDGPTLPGTLHSQRIEGARRLHMRELHVRHVAGKRQVIFSGNSTLTGWASSS